MWEVEKAALNCIEKEENRKRQSQNIFKRKYGLLSESFFGSGKSKRNPLDIVKELEDLIYDIEKDNKDSFGTIDYINMYRDKHKIDENVVQLGVNNTVERIMKNEVLSEKNLSERLKSIAIDIEDEKERIAVETFWVNRMTKIIDSIFKYFYEDEDQCKKIMLGIPSKKGNSIPKRDYLHPDGKKFILEWAKNNGIEVDADERKNFENAKYAFKTVYDSLKDIKQKFYEMKDNNLKLLASQYPEIVSWNNEENIVIINLEKYAFPIMVHYRDYRSDPKFFNPENYEGLKIDRNSKKYLQCFPIKLNEEERKVFFDIMRSEYPGRIPDNNAKDKPESVAGVEATEENISEGVEKRIRNKYKPNEEVVNEIVEILINANVVNQVSEQYIEKLLYVSKQQKTKLGKVQKDIKDYIVDKKIDIEPNDVEVETAKLFTYMKLMERGFWSNGISKERFEGAVSRAMEDIKSPYFNDFIDGINSNKNLDDIKKHIDEKIPIPKGSKKIKGATTLNGNEKVNDKVQIAEGQIVGEQIGKEQIEGDLSKNNCKNAKDADISENEEDPVGYTEADKEEMEKLKIKSTDELTEALKNAIKGIHNKYEKLEQSKKELVRKNEVIKSKIESLGIDGTDYENKLQIAGGILNDPKMVDALEQLGMLNVLEEKYNKINKNLESLRGLEADLKNNTESVNEINSMQEELQENLKHEIDEAFGDLERN